MTYYSKRKTPFSYRITNDFWEAFKAYIEEISTIRGWLPGSRSVTTVDGMFWEVDPREINLTMRQEIGKALYPLSRKPSDEIILDLIEFFFKIVEIPPNDSRGARYKYTVEVNKLFERFKLNYRLKKGKVQDSHSGFMEELLEVDFDIPDKETQAMLILAIEKFHNRDLEEQKIGLEKLVDVYQRISSWEDKNKKRSIEKIITKVSNGNQQIKESFREDIHELWDIANKFMLRHTEKYTIPIKDKDVVEYLFYAYFNVIRFILKKYGYLRENIKGGHNGQKNESI